jgi:kinesin family protein 6/9
MIIISSIATYYAYFMYIYTGRSHIPYRNSMMTSVLRDSLGGNCKTIMIATINPEASHTEESLTTCKFAQRVSLIKNKALINEEMDPSIVIRRLKNELLTLREEIAYLKGESGEGDILTPQQVDELQVQCREYCYDMNPESTLNIGTLTLTKIKDAFAIMKNLVLEALNKSSSNKSNGVGDNYDGGNRTSRGINVGDSEDVMLMNKQVSDLKALLLQRDNEIAILVNMVKKGKTVEDVGMSIQRSSRVGSHDIISATSTSGGGGNGGRRSRDEEEEDYDRARRVGSGSTYDTSQLQQQHQQQSMKPNSNSNKINKNDSNISYQQQQLELQKDREKETQELIIKRHLFGVSPPTNDLSILDDMGKSFEYFCSKCNLNISLNENKEILKEKIAEAKASGERANHSRSTINYLKNSIEALRRERILQKLSNNNNDYKKIKSMKEKNINSDDKDHGDDNNNDDDENEVEDVETEEEVTYRRAIDQEKVVYKESFDRLRVLKPEIENIRKVSE